MRWRPLRGFAIVHLSGLITPKLPGPDNCGIGAAGVRRQPVRNLRIGRHQWVAGNMAHGQKPADIGRRPWTKWYFSDYTADIGLRNCSLAAQGLWVRMLAIMQQSDPYGFLLINAAQPSFADLAEQAGGGASPSDVMQLTAELERRGVFSRDIHGRIYNRRMVRDRRKLLKDQQNGLRGGNPTLISANPQPELDFSAGDKAHMPEARLHIEPANSTSSYENPTESMSSTSTVGTVQKLNGAPTTEPIEKIGKRPEARTEAKIKRGIRITEDWTPRAEDREFAVSLGLDVEEAILEFRDYWTDVPGARGLKLNWSGTWRNSCRMMARSQRGRTGRQITSYETRRQEIRDINDGIDRVIGTIKSRGLSTPDFGKKERASHGK